MIERLLFVQALETVRCFEEGVLTSVADANIGSIFGWSFAPFSAGLFNLSIPTLSINSSPVHGELARNMGHVLNHQRY